MKDGEGRQDKGWRSDEKTMRRTKKTKERVETSAGRERMPRKTEERRENDARRCKAYTIRMCAYFGQFDLKERLIELL